MEYLDFNLEVGPGYGRDHPLSARSPEGEAQGTLRFPYDELDLRYRLKDIEHALRGAGGPRRLVLSKEEQAVQGFGRALFDALVTGDIRSRFDASRAAAVERGMGLRLRLHIHAPQLAALPWEFLYDPRQAEYLCLSEITPVIRYVDLPQSVRPLAITPPLRILGMIASPEGLESLNLEREQGRMKEALEDLERQGLVELTWLSGETWKDLQRALMRGRWHVFHFAGHGGFDPDRDEGLVVFADEARRVSRLTATQLGRLLADHHPLRLVVLNSCEGARGSDHDLFSGTASILVRRGIPAVVAMQYEITDRAAIEFSRSFYEAVAHGVGVDEALASARKAISMAVSNSIEWGTPVLYMRSVDGRLFSLTEQDRSTGPTAARVVAATQPSPKAVEPQGLKEREPKKTTERPPGQRKSEERRKPVEPPVAMAGPVQETLRRTRTRIAVISAGTGSKPAGVAVGGGAVWVANSSSKSAWRIDPSTNTIAARVPIGGGQRDVALTEDAVWVAGNDDLCRIDPATNKVVERIPVCANRLAAGDGALWATTSTGLSKVDPGTNHVVSQVPLPFNPGAIAVGEGSIWVAQRWTLAIPAAVDPIRDVLLRVDSKSGQVSRIRVEGAWAAAVAAGEGAVWVVYDQNLQGRIHKIDPHGERVVKTARLTGQMRDVTVGGGAVWVAGYARIFRINIETLEVEASHKRTLGYGRVAFGEGSAWVIDEYENAVVRVDM